MPFDQTQIKAVIFDWGGVCCSGGEPFASLHLQRRLSKNPDEIASEVRDIYFDYYKGRYDREGFWRQVLSYFKVAEDAELTPERLSQSYLESYVLYPAVLERARQLSVRFKVGLLSNLTPEMRDYIRRAHHTADFFPVEVYSCDPDVAEVKPEEKPYRVILGKLGVSPGEALYIDDTKKNVIGAEQIGMQSYLFTSVEQFLKDSAILV